MSDAALGSGSRFAGMFGRTGTAGVVVAGVLFFWSGQAGATSINVSATCTLQEAVTSVERAVANPSPPPPPEPGCTFVNRWS